MLVLDLFGRLVDGRMKGVCVFHFETLVVR